MNESTRINRLPKAEGSGTFKASGPALEYAKQALSSMHKEETWILAERLDDAMEAVLKEFIAEIRK
jgi:hypothetical protein